MPPSKTFIRNDLFPAALKAPGAISANPREFPMTGAKGQLEFPSGPADFQAWELSGRIIEVDGKRVWRIGVRLGHPASGAVQSTPPALRNTAVREMMNFPLAPGPVGLPPIVNADASKGRRGTEPVRIGGI